MNTTSSSLILMFLMFLATESASAGGTEVQALYRVYDDGQTEVVSPSVDLKHIMYEDQLTVGGGYSADAVSTASSDIETFGSRDSDGEVIVVEDSRTEFSGNASWATSSGTYGFAYIQSDENDYKSRIYSLNASREFFQKNTTLSFAISNGNDVISSSTDDQFSEPMNHQTYNISLTQILSKIALVQFIVDFRVENGFIASPYRRARVESGETIISVPENHPNTRNRNAVAIRYNHFLERYKLSTSTVYRFYSDSWGVGSHTLEERLSRSINKKWDATVNLRYYTQSKADFYEDVYSELGAFFTGNNTLGTFSSILIGVRPTFKYSDNLSIFAKYEKYSVSYKDHTALGVASDPDDDELLSISSTNIGIGITAKY